MLRVGPQGSFWAKPGDNPGVFHEDQQTELWSIPEEGMATHKQMRKLLLKKKKKKETKLRDGLGAVSKREEKPTSSTSVLGFLP